MIPYISNTDNDIQAMLQKIGVASIDDLFCDIQPRHKPKSFDLPEGKSEFEVVQHLKQLASKNATDLILFIGGGYYDHYVPAAVGALVSRGEFYTAYTPYQPECSQGTLQALYEYQSSICALTEMEVANASLYDGGTALYEAAMMAIRITKRSKIVMDGGVSPIYRKILKTYTSNLHYEFQETPVVHGQSSRKEIMKLIDKDTAAIILQNPNFFGAIDDHSDIVEKVHELGVLVIESVYTIALGLIKTPGAMGADIVTGEGQSLGLSLNFGGPYLGFMATRKKYIRKMPGRIIGQTVDANGKRCFVNTLQAREQHIRREKATSNICTNQALNALAATIYLSLLGKQGIKEVAEQCLQKSHYLAEKISQLKTFSLLSNSLFFKEFVIKCPSEACTVIQKLKHEGILAGLDLGRIYPNRKDQLLVAVTEKRSTDELDAFVSALKKYFEA